MNIQQLRQSLKIKWVSYYYKNRSWLEKMRIWATYDGQRRPSSGFILATLSVLEPQLEQIFPFILELNNNPDKIISALGLNFNPEEQSNLIKSDNFIAENLVSSQSSLDTLVSEKPDSENIGDRTLADSNPTEIKIEDTLKSSLTPVSENHSESPASLPHKPDESRHVEKPTQNLTPQPPSLKGSGENSKPLSLQERGLERGVPDPVKSKPHKPTIPLAVATKVQNKSKSTLTFGFATKGESNSVVPLTKATVVQNKSKPLASVAVATVVQNKGKSTKPIAVASRVESNSVVQLALFPEIESKSNSAIAIAEVESKDKRVNMDRKDVPNKVNLSPANKACKLANWVDDFCQGTGRDRE